jgi:hypothetical protein
MCAQAAENGDGPRQTPSSETAAANDPKRKFDEERPMTTPER